MPQDYVGFHKKKKSGLGTTLAIVAAIHLAAAGGFVWLAHTQVGQEWLKVYKINIVNVKEKPPEPPPPKPEPPKPEPEVEPPPEPAPVEEAEAPEPAEAPAAVEAAKPVSLPSFGNPFGAGGKRSKFAGYVDLVTSEIQRRYQQPPDLPDDLQYAVLCQLLVDEDGKVLHYKLIGSSGNPKFDQSAILALSAVERLRPPPPGMSRSITVKFSPPS
jgi:protein TonB